MPQESPDNNEEEGKVSILKKLGFLGFMFFLIKGLLWIIIPSAIAWFGLN